MCRNIYPKGRARMNMYIVVPQRKEGIRRCVVATVLLKVYTSLRGRCCC